MMHLGRAVLAGLAASLCFAMAASAQFTYTVTGNWSANRGTSVDIPQNGGPGSCSPAGQGPCVRLQGVGGVTTGGLPLIVENVPVVPLNGGFKATASATVNATRTGVGGGLTFPTNIFTQMAYFQAHAVPFAVAVRQLDTGFEVAAPMASRRTLSGTPAGDRIGCGKLNAATCLPATGANPDGLAPDGNTRIFRKNAYSVLNQVNYNGTMRPGKDFNVTKPNGNVTGNLEYIGGKNAFGGTMANLLQALPGGPGIPGVTWVGPGFLAAAGFPYALLKIPVTGSGSQHPGRGFSDADINSRAGRQVVGNNLAYITGSGFTSDPVTLEPNCVQTAMGLLATLPLTPQDCEEIGPNNNLVSLTPAPTADITLNYGFPWTTGKVIVSRVGVVFGNPGTEILSAAGKDTTTFSITTGGQLHQVRNIQMVAGGVTRRLPGNPAEEPDITQAIDVIDMQLEYLPEPGENLMLASALAIIAGLYGLRRRLF